MKRKLSLYFGDILECIEKIEKYTRNLNKRDFYKDTEKQDAVVRRLEIIGEAAKNIPSGLKKENPDIPWRDVSDMRNFMIHEYPRVDLSTVWEVIKKDIPKLKKKIALLYNQELEREKEG